MMTANLGERNASRRTRQGTELLPSQQFGDLGLELRELALDAVQATLGRWPGVRRGGNGRHGRLIFDLLAQPVPVALFLLARPALVASDELPLDQPVERALKLAVG